MTKVLTKVFLPSFFFDQGFFFWPRFFFFDQGSLPRVSTKVLYQLSLPKFYQVSPRFYQVSPSFTKVTNQGGHQGGHQGGRQGVARVSPGGHQGVAWVWPGCGEGNARLFDQDQGF